LIEISAVLLERLRFATVFDESGTGVKTQGGFVVADDGQLKLFDPLHCVRYDGVDEATSHAEAARRWLHIHAPEHRLVHGLRPVLPAKAGDAAQFLFDEGAKNVRGFEALLEPGKRHVALAHKHAGVGPRMRFERLQPDLSITHRVRWREQPDPD